MTLAAQMLTDLDIFINPDEFGTAATFTPAGGEASTINGIFNNSVVEINPYTGGSEDVNPTFLVKSSDVTGIKHKDIIVISSVSYEILKRRADDGGMTTLFLNKP